jgi:hypothetical protein
VRTRWIVTWALVAGVAGLAALVGAVVALNRAFINGPAARALAGDPGTARLEMSARYAGWVNPNVLVLDLRRVERPSSAVLFRGVLAIAAVMTDRRLDRVVLARSGDEVFYLDGAAFRELGIGYQTGEDRVGLLLAIPRNLRRLDGSPAFRSWHGDADFVRGEQSRDLNAAARRWTSHVRALR